MDKKECIKILRSVQNELKIKNNINDTHKDEIKNKISNIENLINQSNNLNRYYVFLIIMNLSIFLYSACNDKIENGIGNLIFAIPLGFAIKYFDSQKKEKKKDKSYFEKIINNMEYTDTEISSMEYAIEFLNSLTKEEEEKYLKFKLN